jgi:ribosomal protein S18 acetylase RimI-like enzyme
MVEILFAPGLRPVLKHGSHNQQNHAAKTGSEDTGSGSPKLTIMGKNDGTNKFFNEDTRVVRHQPDGKEPTDYVLYAQKNFVVAIVKPKDGTTINGYSEGGTNKGEIGHLDITGAGSNPWRSSAKNDNKATITEVAVGKAHQRRGLASAMLRFHRDKFPELDVQHSDAQLPDGKAWAEVAKHGSHDQKTHAGRIGVHTGRRTDSKNQQKLDRNLIYDATTMSALPAPLRKKIEGSLEVLGVTQKQMEDNVQAVLDRAKAANDPPEGRDWYEQANNAAQSISDKYGLSRTETAGMIAAMSPQQPWGDNVTAAEYVAKSLSEKHAVQVDDLMGQSLTKGVGQPAKPVTKTMYEWAQAETDGVTGTRKMDGQTHKMPDPDELRGKTVDQLDPYVAAAIIKAHAQMGYRVAGVGDNVDGQQLKTIDDLTGLPAPVKFTCGVHHMGRAVRVAQGESPDEVLNGHKVRSFYNNISGDKSVGTYSDDVTVDSHAFSVAMGVKYGSGSVEYGYFAGSSWPNPASTKENRLPPLHSAVGSATPGVAGSYAAFADAYREVGRRNGLSAREVQSITWVQWRKDNPDQTRGGQMAAMEVENE